MTRDEAYKLVTKWTKNKNLVKHMLAVEAQMGEICKELGSRNKEIGEAGRDSSKLQRGKPVSAESFDEARWKLAGLIHDADYDKWPDEHPRVLLKELKKLKAPNWLYSAVETHAWGFNGMKKEPQTKLEWALYTCDELSGFIIACALVRPDRKLSSVTLDSILKKWREKSFAKGVHREQIELCEEHLGIKLEDYIKLCLKALQGISDELGL